MTYDYTFKRGQVEFHTPVIGTSDLPPQDVISRIEWSNTPDRLNTFFFGPGVLKLIRATDQGEVQLEPNKRTWKTLKREYERNGKEIYLVSIMRPISGYSEAALLSVIGRVSQLIGNGFKNDLV